MSNEATRYVGPFIRVQLSFLSEEDAGKIKDALIEEFDELLFDGENHLRSRTSDFLYLLPNRDIVGVRNLSPFLEDRCTSIVSGADIEHEKEAFAKFAADFMAWLSSNGFKYSIEWGVVDGSF